MLISLMKHIVYLFFVLNPMVPGGMARVEQPRSSMDKLDDISMRKIDNLESFSFQTILAILFVSNRT